MQLRYRANSQALLLLVVVIVVGGDSYKRIDFFPNLSNDLEKRL